MGISYLLKVTGVPKISFSGIHFRVILAGNTVYLLFFGQLSRDAVAGQDVYRRIVGYLGVFYWEVHTLGMDTIFCHDLGENDLFFNPWYLVKTFRGDLDVSGAAPIQNVEDLWQHEEVRTASISECSTDVLVVDVVCLSSLVTLGDRPMC